MDHSVGKHIWVTQIHICMVDFDAKTKNMDRLKMYKQLFPETGFIRSVCWYEL